MDINILNTNKSIQKIRNIDLFESKIEDKIKEKNK